MPEDTPSVASSRSVITSVLIIAAAAIIIGAALSTLIVTPLGGGVPVNLRPVNGVLNADNPSVEITVNFEEEDKSKIGTQKIAYKIIGGDTTDKLAWQRALIDPPYFIYSTGDSLKFELEFNTEYQAPDEKEIILEINSLGGLFHLFGADAKERAKITITPVPEAE